MKRVTIILSCLALVLALAVPCFASGVVLDPTDYITNESLSGDNNIVSISIPASDVNPYWQVSNSNAPFVATEIFDGVNVEVDPEQPDSKWLSVFMRNSIDITSFVNGNSVTVNFTISAEENSEESPYVSNARFNLYYLDSSGNVLNEWLEFFSSVPRLGPNSLTFTLDKPDGAVSMRFALRLENVWNYYNPIICTFDSVDFTTSIPSLLRQQQESGKTNKLLEKIIEYQPTPKPPEFQDDLEDSNNREDALIGKFEDGTLENFGGNIVDASEYLGQFAATFSFVQQMWEPLIQLPWLNAILVSSLGLGLLGGFLGIFVTTSKTESKGRGDD